MVTRKKIIKGRSRITQKEGGEVKENRVPKKNKNVREVGEKNS